MAGEKLDNIHKESENDVNRIRTHEFELYHIWKKLPWFLKGKDVDTIKARFGFEDEEIVDLLQIRTQKVFAEKYNLNKDTLSIWNKHIDGLEDPFEGIRNQLKKVIHNVVWATYNSSLKSDPRANADRKLALQVMGWVEKTENKHEVEIKGLADLLKQNADYKRNQPSSGGSDTPENTR